jgi:DNA-binding MarR family transcriptional regulator
MNGWLKKAWHDPVGSKVIAGVILGGLSAAWLWSASNFSLNGGLAWNGAKDGLRAFVSWLAAPAPISNLKLWIIIGVGAVGWWVAARLRARDLMRRQEGRDSDLAVLEKELAIAGSVGNPTPKVLAPEDLTPEQRLSLHLLYQHYPRGIEVRGLSGPIGNSYAVAEQMCERLAEANLITLTDGEYDPPSAFLTKMGRDYCIEHGLDHQR